METFFDIPGFEGLYKCSKDGYFVREDTGKELIPWKDSSTGPTYLRIEFSKNGKKKTFYVHRLLGKMFKPNPNNHKVVRHLNDNQLDNRLENLCWGTKSENSLDAIRNGKWTHPKGVNSKCFGKTRPYAKGVRDIVDTQTGIFYFGCGEAAKAKNLNTNTLRSKLCGFTKNNTGLIFAQ